jgi:hypothetical protein
MIAPPVREWCTEVPNSLPDGARHGLMVEVLSLCISEVCVHLEDELLPRYRELADFHQFLRVESKHCSGWSSFPMRLSIG